MAAKLILSMDGSVLHEYPLNKERITVGRKQHNDVVIDNLAVSGEHAAIVTILNDSFLEDLDSTNGVMVNGIAIKKHFLQHNDVIEIGKYRLKYLNEQFIPAAEPDLEKTMVLRAPVAASQSEAAEALANPNLPEPDITPVIQREPTGKFAAAATPSAPQYTEAPLHVPQPPAQPASAPPLAIVQLLTGSNAGKELELVKNLTTLGRPGIQVAVITRRPHGYFITHVEGANYPALNGKLLSEQPHQLNNHDIIELAGIKMEFYLKE